MNFELVNMRITDIMTFGVLFFSLTMIYRSRFKTGKTILLLLSTVLFGFCGILIAEKIPYNKLFDVVVSDNIYFVTYILNFFVFGLLYTFTLKGRFISKTAFLLIFCCSVFYTNILCRYILQFILPSLPSLQNVEYSRYISVLIEIILAWIMGKSALKSTRDIPVVYGQVISFTAVSGLIIYLCINCRMFVADNRVSIYEVVESTTMLLLLLLVYSRVSSLVRNYEKSLVMVSYDTLSETQRQMMAETVRLTEELRILRHEAANQNATVAALIDKGEYDKARDLLRDSSPIISTGTRVILSGNDVADAILNQKKAQADAAGIPITFDTFMTKEMQIKDADLSSLLSNLLNNAIEASTFIDNPEIDVKIWPVKNYLCIQIKNKANPETLRNNPMLQTTKKDKAVHGLGLMVIRTIAEKYHGSASFTNEEGWFIARVMLGMCQDK